MKYTMTFQDDEFLKIEEHLLRDTSVEQAGYLLCRISRSSREIRFLAKKFIPVDKNDLNYQRRDGLSIPSDSYIPILKKAYDHGYCFFLVHSHPEEIPVHSEADDKTEVELFKSAYIRVPSTIHGSLILSGHGKLCGRVWLENDDQLSIAPIKLFRIFGSYYRILPPIDYPLNFPIPENFFDRQIKAFGSDLQKILGHLHIGVVGCGGTGSAVIEQLVRLGVGKLTIIDDDKLSETNITRIHGSRNIDVDRPKVNIMVDMIEAIGFGTEVEAIESKVVYQPVAERLKNCELIFGCTDDHAGRAVINAISLYYLIPLIDMAVKVDSKDGQIRNIPGRISIVRPNNRCLLCNGRINPEFAAAELMDKELYQERKRDGYAPELDERDPAVIAFTTAVAAQAVMEMLQLLSGFMGNELYPYEVLPLFDYRHTSVFNDPSASSPCICTKTDIIGRGDSIPFVGMNLPTKER